MKAILSDVIKEGRCACWVRNTVDDALESYRELSRSFGNEQVMLFHARFAMGDRLGIEHTVLETFGKDITPEIRRGKILVATQVVEQSLDLDFDLMITDLTPMDLIIQRAGRLHRDDDPIKRGNRGTPRLIVLTPSFDGIPTAEWYSAAFPKGAYVYPHHGQCFGLQPGFLPTGKRLRCRMMPACSSKVYLARMHREKFRNRSCRLNFNPMARIWAVVPKRT